MDVASRVSHVCQKTPRSNITRTTVKLIFFNLLIFHNFSTANAKLEIDIEDSNTSLIDKILVEIIGRCFANEASETIGLIGKSDPNSRVEWILWNSLATVLIDDPNSLLTGFDDKSTIFPNGLSMFLITECEKYSLEHLLSSLRKTRWWNHEGFFVAIDSGPERDGIPCVRRAWKLLMTVWKMDILSGIFVCVQRSNDGRETGTLYTFNPFAEYGPAEWKKVDTRIGLRGHPWTLFEQPYDPVSTTCRSIKFPNKTFDLNGYKITANVKNYPPYLTINGSATKTNDLGGKQAVILNNLWRKLNATLSLKIYDNHAKFGESYVNGTAQGMIRDLVDGNCDINLNRRYIRKQWGMTFASPMSTGMLYIVTNHRGWKSPLTKITNFMRYEILLSAVVVCFVSVLIIGYSVLRSTKPDLMNVPRLLLSMELRRVPTSMTRRFLLVANMLMVLIVNSAFQGKLAGLLTSRISSEQIETFDDVNRMNYDLYGFRYLTEFIDANLSDKFIDPVSYELGFCADILADHRRAACIAQTSDLPMLVGNDDLYISNNKIAYFHKSNGIRKNWPLTERFNGLIGRLVDGGLTRYWAADETTKLGDRNAGSSQESLRPLRYDDLNFSLKILGIGLGIATFVFIAEIFVARVRKLNVFCGFHW